MHNFMKSLGVRFTDEEKQLCLPTAYKMINLSFFVKMHGIISLEEATAHDSEFTKMCAELFLSCNADDEIIEKVFCYIVMADGHTGAALLERLIIAQGLSLLRDPHNPNYTPFVIASILGEKYLPELTDAANPKIRLNILTDPYLCAFPESAEFQHDMQQLSKEQMYRKLACAEHRAVAAAFKGCDAPFMESMRSRLSIAAIVTIGETMGDIEADKGEILRHQAAILSMSS
ncbi:MAG: hypothetical protein FWD98_05505 [Defluviitaleaceae bacterium]|nr:hypothetical protein [Defluviitaleaceae bacterium]